MVNDIIEITKRLTYTTESRQIAPYFKRKIQSEKKVVRTVKIGVFGTVLSVYILKTMVAETRLHNYREQLYILKLLKSGKKRNTSISIMKVSTS